MLNSDTAIIHVEKANGEVKGIYSAINQEFAMHAWGDTMFLNHGKYRPMDFVKLKSLIKAQLK